MDSKGNVRHFFGVRFAWHGLESCCCSGVSEPASKGLAPMVSEPQLGCRTKALVLMGSKGNGKHFVGPGFAWHGLSILSDLRLQGTCANGFGTSLAPRVPDKRTVFYGFQRWREAFCRAAFCLAWARILLLFGCFGTGLQRTCSKATGVFPCKGSAVLTRVFFPWPWPCQQREKASWQCLLLMPFFCDFDGALPFWPVCFFLGRGRASNAKSLC